MKRKLLLLMVMSFVPVLNVSAVNITIIQSIMASGYNGGEDTLWRNYAISMGYNAKIYPMSALNDTSFFDSTDVLIVSEGTGAISNTQMQTIITFVKRGKSAYIQSEYLASLPGDVTFQAIMDSVGADFSWVSTVAGQLIPMQILAPFSTTPYQTNDLNYFWYGENGTGCGVDSFLEYNNQYFGYFYHQNNNYGRVITTSDQDWVWTISDSLLVKNMLYHLVEPDTAKSNTIRLNIAPQSPSICNGGSVLLKASGANTYTWSPATGLNATTGDSILASPTTTTTYTLTGNTGCGEGTVTLIVTVTPSLPLTIVPPSAVFCNGLNATLTISNEGTDFEWSPSTGLSATTGDSVVASPTSSVTYTVTGTDSNGCAETGSDVVTVIPSPNKPTFYQHGDTLFSSSLHDNQWYRNDTLLLNDTSQYVIITALGEYLVNVNNEANGCSTSSDSIDITQVTGLKKLAVESGQLTVYPNPFTNELFVKINSSVGDINDWDLVVTDVLGRTLFTKSPLNPLKGTFEIDLSNLTSGVYFITVITKTGRAVFPVVKQN